MLLSSPLHFFFFFKESNSHWKQEKKEHLVSFLAWFSFPHCLVSLCFSTSLPYIWFSITYQPLPDKFLTFLPVTLRLFPPLAPTLLYTFYTWCRYMVACLVLSCNISGKRSADMCSSAWTVLQTLCYFQKSWPRTNSSKTKERVCEKLQQGEDAHVNRKKHLEAYKNYWKHLPSINYYTVMGKWCHLVPNPSSFSHSSNLLLWLFCPLLYRNTHLKRGHQTSIYSYALLISCRPGNVFPTCHALKVAAKIQVNNITT